MESLGIFHSSFFLTRIKQTEGLGFPFTTSLFHCRLSFASFIQDERMRAESWLLIPRPQERRSGRFQREEAERRG